MRFSFFKKQLGSRPDSLLKTVSLYVVLTGLLILVAIGLSLGMWGILHKPLPLGFFFAGVAVTAAGCAELMVDDSVRFIKRQLQKYSVRKGGTR